MPTDLTRRDLLRLGLLASAAAGLAACTTSPAGSGAPTDPGGPQDPDRALRSQVGADEARLSTLYGQAAAALPASSSARIVAIGARHEAYRTAVDPAGLVGATGASGASGPSSSVAPPSAPPTAVRALALLVSAETAAAAARARQAAQAVDPELARILVLVGAGEAAAASALASARAR